MSAVLSTFASFVLLCYASSRNGLSEWKGQDEPEASPAPLLAVVTCTLTSYMTRDQPCECTGFMLAGPYSATSASTTKWKKRQIRA